MQVNKTLYQNPSYRGKEGGGGDWELSAVLMTHRLGIPKELREGGGGILMMVDMVHGDDV